MRTEQARSLSVKAKNFTIDLTQTAGGRARGTLRLFDAKSHLEMRMGEAGLLQADGKWASFTARARATPDAGELTVLVIVDGGNPMNPKATIRVDLEDGRRLESALEAREYSIRY
jgi:hypothetical protein